MFGGHVFAIVHYTFFFYLKSVELIRVLCNIMISPLPPPPHTHTPRLFRVNLERVPKK